MEQPAPWELEVKRKKELREKKWLVIAGGLNALFIEDLEQNGQVSSSALTKFQDSIATLKDSNGLVESKTNAIKTIRKIFRERNELDHFLFLSGLRKDRPSKPSKQIEQVFL